MEKRGLKNKITEKYFVIFDGECGFCNKTVLFLATRDTDNIFIFVSNASALGKELLEEKNIYSLSQHTIILIKDNRYWIKSQAIEIILSQLPGYKYLSLILHIIPSFLSNFFYDVFALIRKRIFKNDKCPIPNIQIKEKIILS